MAYFGDISLEDTIDIKFCTVTTTGAPTQLAGTPVISAYPGNSTTQLTAGITLTVDFDSVTGLNNVRVAATGANGYATATNYALVITTGTVGGTSVVGYVVGSFSIENRVLNAAKIATDAITAAKIAAGAIGASEIADGAIDAATFAAGAITATVIADGAIDAATFAAGAIDATAIAANAITSSEIADGAITAAKFAAGAIDATAIATDAIGSAELSTAAANKIRDTIMPPINTAFSNIEFLMVLASDDVTPATGLTVSGTRSIDGGAFAAATGTIAEVGNGIYQIDASQADMNGKVITFRFTATNANDTFLTIVTGGT
ncbi:MAG: hypothetical protein MN733_00080 [Nitrososphaera sp.]|nr:hypothetical protein [Nitrososphaera sp.]